MDVLPMDSCSFEGEDAQWQVQLNGEWIAYESLRVRRVAETCEESMADITAVPSPCYNDEAATDEVRKIVEATDRFDGHRLSPARIHSSSATPYMTDGVRDGAEPADRLYGYRAAPVQMHSCQAAPYRARRVWPIGATWPCRGVGKPEITDICAICGGIRFRHGEICGGIRFWHGGLQIEDHNFQLLLDTVAPQTPESDQET